MNPSIIARQLDIKGVVQGVGFRPFLYMLAAECKLAGEVSNTAEGVRVHVEGEIGNLKRFESDIPRKIPPLAAVTTIASKNVSRKNLSGFRIVKSRQNGSRDTLISPDVSTCRDCLAELNDPADRRFAYPFINCTNCGPRFTIIEDIPYDRPKTSMKHFAMCDLCQEEYDDPMDRRFHAQPNACPVCGPRVFLTDKKGREIDAENNDAIGLAARYLKEGKILGVKGLGGFHLACSAADQKAVRRLRKRKARPHKPFALMAGSLAALSGCVDIDEKERRLLESYHRPIVLLKKKEIVPQEPSGRIQEIAPEIAPLNSCLGVMLPYTPLHYLLLEKGPDILVMTSGNRSGEPLSIENQDAVDSFCHIADFFLLHNRDIYFRADDSIMRVQAEKPRFIRRSRGYAPMPVTVERKMPGVLGCGAGLKNTVCVTRGKEVFLSQHIGDLENIKSNDYFQTSIAHLKQIFDVRPGVIAHDLHPGYMSSIWAVQQDGQKKSAVQHHHAHAVSCMAENHLDGKVIAITLDGTGYGTDGHIWGGEILVCSHGAFQRAAHLAYLQMPGGDKAALEPWRMAASLLYATFGSKFSDLNLEYIRQTDSQKLEVVRQMMERGLNCPLSSGAGRLFDAMASLLCIRHEITYESQAAMELEALALNAVEPEIMEQNAPGQAAGDIEFDLQYGFDIERLTGADESTGQYEISMLPCVRQIVGDLLKGVPLSRISLKFHYTVVAAFLETARKVRKQYGLNRVVLSGGVFNNDIILTKMIGMLEQCDFEVYTHTKVPTGDGGICLGQVVAAAAMEDEKQNEP